MGRVRARIADFQGYKSLPLIAWQARSEYIQGQYFAMGDSKISVQEGLCRSVIAYLQGRFVYRS